MIDMEGGHASLFVTPSGHSLLIDVGNAGGRDTDRIMEAIADAGLQQIDYLVLTHYHADHVGGLKERSSSGRSDTLPKPCWCDAWRRAPSGVNGVSVRLADRRSGRFASRRRRWPATFPGH